MSAVSGRSSAELLQKIKTSVSILDVVGESVRLRKSGVSFTGLCPFHSERTPSFNVNPNKQLYHCYGCGKGGDLISFVMEMHGLGFREAVEELAERARIPLPPSWTGESAGERAGEGGGLSPEALEKREKARQKLLTAYRLNRFVAGFYHRSLSRLPGVSRYLQKRGVSSEWVRNFYVGAAPSGWSTLSDYLATQKAPLDLASELGLVRPSNRGGYFDLFRSRVIFPILDLRGRVVGFGGRSLPLEYREDGAAGGEEKPKYLNSTESLIFHKGRLVFGLFQAQKHIRELDEVIVVEGYFDVLALHAAGFQNAVALCGASLSTEHLTLLRKFAKKITLLLDGDQAGIAATERAMEVGLAEGMVLYGARIPEGQDPDEILFHSETGEALPEGVERMRKLLSEAEPLLDMRINETITSALQSPEAKVQALKRLAGWLGRFADPIGREVRSRLIESRLGVDRALLSQASGAGKEPSAPTVAAIKSPRPLVDPRPVASRGVGDSGLRRGERDLLAAWLQGEKFSSLFQEFGSKLPPGLAIADFFDSKAAREWVREFEEKGMVWENVMKDPAFWAREGKDGSSDSPIRSQIRSLMSEIWVSDVGEAAGESRGRALSLGREQVEMALKRILARRWAQFSQRIKAALADAEARKDAGLQAQLMKEYLDVQRKMKEFSSFI